MNVRVLWLTVQTTDVEIPSLEMMALLLVLMLCLIFRTVRTGLIVSYLFVFRWGALFFNEVLTSQSVWFLRTYLVLGLLIPILCAKRLWFTSDI